MYDDKEDVGHTFEERKSNFASVFQSILSNERPINNGYEKLESEDSTRDRVSYCYHTMCNPLKIVRLSFTN